MAFSKKLLSEGEHVLLETHPHAKVLTGNFIGGALVVALAVLGAIYLPHTWRPAVFWVDAVVALILLWIVTLGPWMSWAASYYVVTNRRVIARDGVFTRTGHDIPLARTTDLTFKRDITDRGFGSGTLIIYTAADQPHYLRNVPKVERVHALISDLLTSGSTTSDTPPALAMPSRSAVQGNVADTLPAPGVAESSAHETPHSESTDGSLPQGHADPSRPDNSPAA